MNDPSDPLPAFQVEYISRAGDEIMLAGRALADIKVGDTLWRITSDEEFPYTVTTIEMYHRPMEFVDAGMTAAIYVIGEPGSIPDHVTLHLHKQVPDNSPMITGLCQAFFPWHSTRGHSH